MFLSTSRIFFASISRGQFHVAVQNCRHWIWRIDLFNNDTLCILFTVSVISLGTRRVTQPNKTRWRVTVTELTVYFSQFSCNFFFLSFTLSFFLSYILLNSLFPSSLYFSFKVRDQIPHPCKTMGKIIVLCFNV